jgi:hypothetical protein
LCNLQLAVPNIFFFYSYLRVHEEIKAREWTTNGFVGRHLTWLLQKKRDFSQLITADYAPCFMKYYYDVLIVTGVMIVVLEKKLIIIIIIISFNCKWVSTRWPLLPKSS